jgi:hypothetical protein
MADSVSAFRRKPYAAIVAAGLASGVLYLSVFLSVAFLLPVQVAFGRLGWREGLAAAGISAALIAAAQAWTLAAAGALGLAALASGTLPPLVVIGALALMNAPFGRGWKPSYRALGATALCAAAALPVIVAFGRDASIAAYLEERIGSITAPLRSAVASSGDGYELSALAASLDPKYMVASAMSVLRDSYAAMIFLLLAGSWRLGNRLSGEGSRGRAETVAIDGLRLPFSLVWAFLASWSLVLAALLLRAPVALAALAWNCALVLSLAYAAQGIGIVTYLLKSMNAPKPLRIAIAVTAAIALATPTLGVAVAAALPLFGVTEIWIPYRKPKGVGA